MAAAAAAVEALPDDLLLEIFSRLQDPIDVLRCAAACGPWFRVILAATAAGHLTPALPRRGSSFVLGAFHQRNELPVYRSAPSKPSYSRPPRFVRLHDPPLPAGPAPIVSNSSDDDGLLYAKPLASRRGLLLSRLMPPPDPLDRRKLRLAVCHPLLAGRPRLLPPPPFDLDPELPRDLTGYALLPDVDGPGEFRVLITAVVVSDSGDHHHRACSYSSATDLWSAPVECPTGALAMSGPRAGTVDAHGTAHWLYRENNSPSSSFYTLSISGAGDATLHATLAKLPITVHLLTPQQQIFQRALFLFPCLTGGGDLALVHKRWDNDTNHGSGSGGTLDLWAKADDGSRSWVRSELEAFPHSAFLNLRGLGLAESAGKLLVHHGIVGLFLWIDVESGAMERVRSLSCNYDRTCRERHYSTHVCGDGLAATCQGYDSCHVCTYNCGVIYEVHWASFLRHISAWS